VRSGSGRRGKGVKQYMEKRRLGAAETRRARENEVVA